MTRDVPIEIRRGNDDPAVIWEFANADGTPANLAGSVFELVVAWPAVPYSAAAGPQPGGEIAHSSDAVLGDGMLTIDVAAGRVTWPYTIAESDLIPRGQGPRYALRRVIGGKTRDWAGGPVTVRSFLP
ncbi:hypothetical protein QO001_000853 [Methylobacterium brachiatum]|jgi:hypothetical protein|uniref:Uncharacterized protein n=1 Tax=Methylobacterium brachiatum TaxID=269660 RepID=A0AAJ1WUT8_9HYPH|nr:hypothetical protein [Methylobacterium brachiatum]MCB4803508.1 hypothetical protein [Methylobacterium brachiatum]MDQ0541945.1 hypothetical protein [Methylobacterium brachiatum]